MSNQTHRVNYGADYVIVGAGSAGCVMARRLSDTGASVILLEAGPGLKFADGTWRQFLPTTLPSKSSLGKSGLGKPWYVRMPSAFYIPMHMRNYNWGYKAEPEATLNYRRLDCPRGRGMGGSSAINGMVYVRGHAEDFNRWQALGAEGWRYADVLPYFLKAQGFQGEIHDSDYQNPSGPLAVRNGTRSSPLYQAFLDAAAEAGYPISADLNGADQEGFGPLPMTVGAGQRSSTDVAYLTAATGPLTILSDFHTHRVLLEDKYAKGVTGRHQGQEVSVFANKEVILCCGAIGSPQVLQLSGIGHREHLEDLNITCQHHLPGVGNNLMDHLEVYVQQACSQPVSLYKHLSPWGKVKIGLQWLTTHTGLGATNHFEVGGFIRSKEEAPYPDIQFHFLPAAMSYDGTNPAGCEGFQVHVGPMLSKSRGHVRIRSNNPDHAPEIRFNYMSHAEDWQVFRAAIRKAREIFDQPALKPYRGCELAPGANHVSDAQLDEFVRSHAQSAYHPCGTCKMGDDEEAVVDKSGRVHGLEALRVVDASIFPHITNGNLNAPTIMVAEKIAADMVSHMMNDTQKAETSGKTGENALG